MYKGEGRFYAGVTVYVILLANTENNVGSGSLCRQACVLYSKQEAYLNDKYGCMTVKAKITWAIVL